MVFRKATFEDIKQLIGCRKKQLIDEGMMIINNVDTEMQSYFETHLKTGDLISWVALEDEKIIATSAIWFYQLPPSYEYPSGKYAYITNMYTEKGYRGQGIASELLKRVIDEAKTRDHKVIRLSASEQGKPLYKKHGFVEVPNHMILKL